MHWYAPFSPSPSAMVLLMRSCNVLLQKTEDGTGCIAHNMLERISRFDDEESAQEAIAQEAAGAAYSGSCVPSSPVLDITSRSNLWPAAIDTVSCHAFKGGVRLFTQTYGDMTSNSPRCTDSSPP